MEEIEERLAVAQEEARENGNKNERLEKITWE